MHSADSSLLIACLTWQPPSPLQEITLYRLSAQEEARLPASRLPRRMASLPGHAHTGGGGTPRSPAEGAAAAGSTAAGGSAGAAASASVAQAAQQQAAATASGGSGLQDAVARPLSEPLGRGHIMFGNAEDEGTGAGGSSRVAAEAAAALAAPAEGSSPAAQPAAKAAVEEQQAQSEVAGDVPWAAVSSPLGDGSI